MDTYVYDWVLFWLFDLQTLNVTGFSRSDIWDHGYELTLIFKIIFSTKFLD